MEKKCPLNPEYRFTSCCTIKTCKNFTPSTANRCMMLDVRASSDDAVISDAELLHYKFPDREGMEVRDVTRIRRKLVDRVQQWVMFHHIVNHIEATCKPDEFVYVTGRSLALDSVVSSKPFVLEEFSFKDWMIKRLLDATYTASLVPQFSLKTMLGITQRDFDSLCKDVRIMESGNTLFETIV